MSCDETKRLAADEASITKFSDAVSKLRKKIGVSARDVYQQLDRAANEARVKSDQPRLGLEEHIAAQGC